jgi:hypothetical protein
MTIAYYLFTVIKLAKNKELTTLVLIGKNDVLNSIYIYIICWGIPIVLTLLPLITETYGTLNEEEFGLCYLQHRNKYPSWTLLFWFMIGFFGWVFLVSFIHIFILIYTIIFYLKDMILHDNMVTPLIIKAIKKLILYPIIILSGSILTCFYVIFANDPSSVVNTELYFQFANALALLNGMFTSLAFFTASQEAKSQLYSDCYNIFSSCIDVFMLTTPQTQKEVRLSVFLAQGSSSNSASDASSFIPSTSVSSSNPILYHSYSDSSSSLA